VRGCSATGRTKNKDDGKKPVATLVQVTNLGITVKDSPQNTLVLVTRLDTGAPVGGADVSNSSGWTTASRGRADSD